VQFSSTPTAALFSLLSGNGATTKKKFNHVPKVQVISVPERMVPFIAQLPGVKLVSPDRKVVKHLDLTAGTVGSAIANQYGWTGKNIGIAVIDSGVDATNADLKTSNGASRVVYSELHGPRHIADRYGRFACRRHCRRQRRQFRRCKGIAPESKIINLRVLDETAREATAG
jgi:serine protease AprX